MKLDGVGPDDWNRIFGERNNMKMLSMRDVTYSNGSTANVLTIVQTMSPDGGWGAGSIVYFVSRDQLVSYMNDMAGEYGGSFQLSDASGAAVYTSDDFTPGAGNRIVLETR